MPIEVSLLQFTISCPLCDADVDQLAPGVAGQYRTTCMVKCQKCLAEYQLTVDLSRTTAPKRIKGRVRPGIDGI
jgi:hypothetical protein